MSDPFKLKSIQITLFDKGDACAVLVTTDPEIPKDRTLEGTEQPCVLTAYATLSALLEQEVTEGQPFKGMRKVPE